MSFQLGKGFVVPSLFPTSTGYGRLEGALAGPTQQGPCTVMHHMTHAPSLESLTYIKAPREMKVSRLKVHAAGTSVFLQFAAFSFGQR